MGPAKGQRYKPGESPQRALATVSVTEYALLPTCPADAQPCWPIISHRCKAAPFHRRDAWRDARRPPRPRPHPSLFSCVSVYYLHPSPHRYALRPQAAADYFGLRIMVVTSFKESPVIYIDPAAKRSPRTLYLSFWAEVHYNSLYPAQVGDVCARRLVT